LILAAVYLVRLGGNIRAVRDTSQLPSQYGQTMLFLAAGFGLVPALIGAFWGALVRRTLPAMAMVFLAVIAVQFAVPNLLRPHSMPAERVTVPMTADAINQARSLGNITGGPVVGGLQMPGAWVTDTSKLLTPDDRQLSNAAFNEFQQRPEDRRHRHVR
jgi:hypothetical protein